MNRSLTLNDPKEVASAIDAELCALRVRNTPSERAVLRRHSRMLKGANPEFVLDVARALLKEHRWLAYELIAGHKAAFQSIGGGGGGGIRPRYQQLGLCGLLCSHFGRASMAERAGVR